MTDEPNRRPRIGAVAYLNSKPLIEGLPQLLPNAELLLDYPSRLADDLAAGEIDVGLVPVVECLRNDRYAIISDACVASRGPVLSVKLLSRVPMQQIRSLALDDGSRTSAILVRILLRELCDIDPQPQPLPMGEDIASTDADANLLIGDRAMHQPADAFVATWDLGEEWFQWTGLPFVFAVWAARLGCDDGDLAEKLASARDCGITNLRTIAQRECRLLGISEETAYHYLSHNLHFQLGADERAGLERFRELAVQHRLLNREEPV